MICELTGEETRRVENREFLVLSPYDTEHDDFMAIDFVHTLRPPLSMNLSLLLSLPNTMHIITFLFLFRPHSPAT
jgi:hypothetical protein